MVASLSCFPRLRVQVIDGTVPILVATVVRSGNNSNTPYILTSLPPGNEWIRVAI